MVFDEQCRYHAVTREMLAVLHPVMPKGAGTNGAKINDDGVSMLK